ncbi:MAG: hypothetical protein OEY38_16905 [Gammaproteobacteria bacterium]|nr:hypothetical protein [Gammaproteobacteria bacterium]
MRTLANTYICKQTESNWLKSNYLQYQDNKLIKEDDYKCSTDGITCEIKSGSNFQRSDTGFIDHIAYFTKPPQSTVLTLNLAINHESCPLQLNLHSSLPSDMYRKRYTTQCEIQAGDKRLFDILQLLRIE